MILKVLKNLAFSAATSGSSGMSGKAEQKPNTAKTTCGRVSVKKEELEEGNDVDLKQ